MSVIRSFWRDAGRADAGRPAERLLLPGWVAFAAANTVLMFAWPKLETVPFHLIWFSLALVSGLAPWRPRTLVLALVGVTVVSAVARGQDIAAGYMRPEELLEVPLEASIFLIMVWHVRRRQAALRQVEELAAADRDRAEGQRMFVRLMSHAMRTPITVVRGYTELIRATHDDPQTVEDTDIVLDELGKLELRTQRLVALMTADQQFPNERVDLDQVLARAARRWAPTVHRHWRVDSTAGAVLIDGDRLDVVVHCLLENAVKYSADGDEITVRGRSDDGVAVIEVTDTGAGIPAADLPYVFDTFHRGENSALIDGTGLGLAIVRRIVSRWGGTVAVDSTLGLGSTFTVRIPGLPARPESDDRLAG
jgi:two-component system, OmpR family, sensor kinase